IQRGLKDSKTEHARVVIARDSLREKMEQFRTDLRDIAKRNISLQSEVAQMQALVESSKAERDEVTAARERLNRRLAEIESALAAANGRGKDLETQLADLNGRLTAVSGERDSLIDLRERLNRRLTEVASALAAANGHGKGLETQLADLNGRLTAVSGERDSLIDLRERLNSRIAVLESDLRDAATQGAALNNRIASLSQSLARQAGASARVQSERDFLQRRASGLEQQLVDLRDAGQGVLTRLSERTRGSVDEIEKTVRMTGLDVNDLLADATDDNLGRGGPFIPAGDGAAEFEPSLQLEGSVVRLDQELDRWGAMQSVLRSLPLSAPLNQYRISSRYGERRDPVNRRKAKHLGLDFAARGGAAIYSTAPGKVVFAGWRGRYGRMVEIDHGYGIRTRYAHMRKILVKKGQEVANREKIGLVGSSGRSTGSHTHYEVRYKGRSQNPAKFLQAGKYVFKG
ncbi:MAG: peptidoglycan DD-metalloendopeptidase family protein, partial [Kiloniellaceae bacterium]